MYNRKIVAQPLEVSRAKIIMKNRRRRRNGGYSNNSMGGYSNNSDGMSNWQNGCGCNR